MTVPGGGSTDTGAISPESSVRDDEHSFFCFVFNRWQATACGHKGCARRKVNKEAGRG